MHLIDIYQGEPARELAAQSAPFGPGFDLQIVNQIKRLEVWASSFRDSGPDTCEFRAFDAQEGLITRRTLSGF